MSTKISVTNPPSRSSSLKGRNSRRNPSYHTKAPRGDYTKNPRASCDSSTNVHIKMHGPSSEHSPRTSISTKMSEEEQYSQQRRARRASIDSEFSTTSVIWSPSVAKDVSPQGSVVDLNFSVDDYTQLGGNPYADGSKSDTDLESDNNSVIHMPIARSPISSLPSLSDDSSDGETISSNDELPTPIESSSTFVDELTKFDNVPPPPLPKRAIGHTIPQQLVPEPLNIRPLSRSQTYAPPRNPNRVDQNIITPESNRLSLPPQYETFTLPTSIPRRAGSIRSTYSHSIYSIQETEDDVHDYRSQRSRSASPSSMYRSRQRSQSPPAALVRPTPVPSSYSQFSKFTPFSSSLAPPPQPRRSSSRSSVIRSVSPFTRPETRQTIRPESRGRQTDSSSRPVTRQSHQSRRDLSPASSIYSLNIDPFDHPQIRRSNKYVSRANLKQSTPLLAILDTEETEARLSMMLESFGGIGSGPQGLGMGIGESRPVSMIM